MAERVRPTAFGRAAKDFQARPLCLRTEWRSFRKMREDDLTVGEAADALGTSPQTIRALLRKGDLQGQKRAWGTRYVWVPSRQGINDFLSEHGRIDGHRRRRQEEHQQLEQVSETVTIDNPKSAPTLSIPSPREETFEPIPEPEPSASKPFVLRPRGRATAVVVALGVPLFGAYAAARIIPELSGSASWASLPSSTASWQRGSSCMSSSRARLRSLSRRTWRSPAGRVTPSGRARPPLPLWRCRSSPRLCSPSPRARTGRRSCCGGTASPSASSTPSHGGRWLLRLLAPVRAPGLGLAALADRGHGRLRGVGLPGAAGRSASGRRARPSRPRCTSPLSPHLPARRRVAAPPRAVRARARPAPPATAAPSPVPASSTSTSDYRDSAILVALGRARARLRGGAVRRADRRPASSRTAVSASRPRCSSSSALVGALLPRSSSATPSIRIRCSASALPGTVDRGHQDAPRTRLDRRRCLHPDRQLQAADFSPITRPPRATCRSGTPGCSRPACASSSPTRPTTSPGQPILDVVRVDGRRRPTVVSARELDLRLVRGAADRGSTTGSRTPMGSA